MTTRRNPPAELKLVCGLAAVAAGLDLLFALAGLAESLLFLAPVAGVLALLSGALAVGQVAALRGVWRLQTWAWVAAVSLFGADAVLGLVVRALGHGGLLGPLVAVAVVAYLLARRELFLRPAPF